MKQRRLSLLIVSLLAAGCSSQSSPTTTAPSAPATPVGQTVTLSGSVKDSVTGNGLAATIAFLDGVNAGRTTTADVFGTFSFPPLPQGGFTVSASFAGYTTQQQPVLLTQSMLITFLMVKVPVASLNVDGTPARFAAQPDGSFAVSWDMHNLGTACAGNVTGAYAAQDSTNQTLQVLQWSLPAGTIIQPGQAFSPTACCLTPASAQASRAYLVSLIAVSSVACR